MLEGTDAAILDILFGYPAMQKNLLVAERKIEVPLQGLNDITFSSQAFALIEAAVPPKPRTMVSVSVALSAVSIPEVSPTMLAVLPSVIA